MPSIEQPTGTNALGLVVALMLESPLHSEIGLGHLRWMLVPALKNKQYWFCFNAEETKVIGFVSWAFLGEAEEKKFKERYFLSPNSWQSGEALWIVDCVCLPDAHEDVLRRFKSEKFPETDVKALKFSNNNTQKESADSE